MRNSEISQPNKDLILAYRDACLIKNVCGKVRLLRVQGCLLLYARILKKDFDQCTKADIEQLVAHLVSAQPAYSPETLSTYKAMLRSFMTWVVQPDQFPTKTPPPIVSWISTHIRMRDRKRIERKDLLTPEDIEKLLGVCHNTRDKALIAILWETGARIAEIGNLQIQHVTKREHGYTLDLTGKTGQRSPLIISSAPYLSTWLNSHPFRDQPEAPLWVHYQYKKTPEQLKYDTIRHVLCRLFERTGITKPFNPHIFRHSRATQILSQGIMSEQSCRLYMGWSKNSEMLENYCHLINSDCDAQILRENNLVPQQQIPRPRIFLDTEL